MKTVTLLAMMLTLALSSARADIIEWQDADGIRHFTNNKDDLPGPEPGRVIVTERARAEVAAPAPAPEPPPEPPRQAQVVYDYSALANVYLQGLQDGLLRGRDGGAGGAVQINGPLAVANAPSFATPWYPPYAPFVTTSFDRGRSRHLTLRMLLEDQFQLDRDGPFVHERLIPVGEGVALNPFLPRGLPHGVPRGVRVLH